MGRLKIYEYEKCSTCRKALKFLDQKGVSYERIPIVEKPPSIGELRRMLEAQGGNLKKLFNTSGLQYRELKLGEKLPSMTEEQAIRLLSTNGKLVKRPFALEDPAGKGFAAVGFDEKQWKRRW
jgi:arsenate reductase (glutaredoxin)